MSFKNRHRDFVTINETWRKQKEGLWTRQRHTFAATRKHNKACPGTAIVIHKRWTKHIKEVQHSRGRLTEVSSVHFPHTGTRRRTRPTESHRVAPVAMGRIKKAFDTVRHSSVWKAVREQGIEEPDIQSLTKLHDQQRATVHTDANSKHSHFHRETKQGDPLSTLFCNSLLQYIMKPLAGKWKRENFGVKL